MLSFVTSNHNEVFIHADKDGLESLKQEIERLQRALEKELCEDGHLFSKSWGGDELNESMLDSQKDEGCEHVHHVKFFSWTNEWLGKHGLDEGDA